MDSSLVARVWFARIDVNRMLLSNGFARVEEEETSLWKKRIRGFKEKMRIDY